MSIIFLEIQEWSILLLIATPLVVGDDTPLTRRGEKNDLYLVSVVAKLERRTRADFEGLGIF